MKNEKGITLIALIIIIVLLFILAGISICLVVNNENNSRPSGPANNNIINTIEKEYVEETRESYNVINDSSKITNEVSNKVSENVVNEV